MITVNFEIPDEIAIFIKDVLGVEPKTYVQNELINPIHKKYKEYIKDKKVEEAKVEADGLADNAKKSMKLKITNIVQ